MQQLSEPDPTHQPAPGAYPPEPSGQVPQPDAVPPLEALPPHARPGQHAHRIEDAPPVAYVQPVQAAQPVAYVQPVEYVEPIPPVPVAEPAPVVVDSDAAVRPLRYLAPADARELRLQRIARTVYTIVAIVSVLIAVRIVLRLLGANPDAAFSRFWYGLTEPFVLPFEGVFPAPSYKSSAFELSSLLAIGIYWLIAWIVIRLLRLGNHRDPSTPTVP